jgi:hypothetical protein
VYEVCLYKYFCGMTKWCHDACYPPHCRILVAWLALADFQSPSPSTSCTSHVDLRPIRKQILFLRKRVSCRDKELRVSFFFPLEQYYLLDMKLIAPLNIQISFICALMSCVETNIPMILHICITCRQPPVAVPNT